MTGGFEAAALSRIGFHANRSVPDFGRTQTQFVSGPFVRGSRRTERRGSRPETTWSLPVRPGFHRPLAAPALRAMRLIAEVGSRADHPAQSHNWRNKTHCVERQ